MVGALTPDDALRRAEVSSPPAQFVGQTGSGMELDSGPFGCILSLLGLQNEDTAKFIGRIGSMKKTSPEALENSMPSLVEKLKTFHKNLSPEERVVFGEIVVSAARHTQSIRQHDLAVGGGAKPMSVHATNTIKERFLKLPAELGIED